MMFKKTTHLVFGIALVFGLVSCGSDSSGDDEIYTPTNPTRTPTSTPTPTHSDEDSSPKTPTTNNEGGSSTVVDRKAPTITITGDNPLTITQGETFSDPGATAMDNIDGVLAVTPTGVVDMDIAGEYTLTYTATDSSNNKTTATRTVIVKSADVVWNVSTVTEFRQALENASANGENDRIVLAKGTYNVTSDGLGTLTFDDNEAFDLTIESAEGLTRQDVILSGNKTTQVFNFNNTASSTLIFKGISVIDGNSTTSGGGIYTNQNIEIKNCNISKNNTSGSYSYGGGFYSNGTTIVTNSTIFNNNSYNNGGGFYSSGTITVTNSTISNNNSYNNGGGFYSSGTTTVTNSTISNNSSNYYYDYYYGGGFYSNGITTVTNSTISNNSSNGRGGGFYSYETTTVTNSTISNNNSSKGSGGGFFSSGTTTVTNSTISNNSSRYNGGGFYADTTTIINSIFTENNATVGAIYSSYYSSYTSNNTFIKNRGSIYAKGIFVNNIFYSNDADITLTDDSKIYNNYIDYSKIEDNGHNVIKKQNLQPASIGDVHLNSDTKTLASNSPVIDKGLNPSSATYKKIIGGEKKIWNSETREYEMVYPQYEKMLELLKTDNIGNRRVHNGTIDIGAVEYGASK